MTIAGTRKEQRVVITGMGLVTPVGIGVEDSWSALVAGTSGGGPITLFEADEEYTTRIACEVDGFDPLSWMDKKDARRFDRFAQFALAAAGEALEAAGLSGVPGGTPAERCGVVFGSGVGGMNTMEDNARAIVERGPGRVSPFFVPMFIPDIAAGLISIRYGMKGVNFATVSACASGAHAIGEGFRSVQRGDSDLVITGGSEAAVTPLTIAGFGAMKAMSTRNDDPARASRPFDADRDGFVIGEGAGALVLESLEHALARGAPIVAELVGYGASGDAFHITSPPPGHVGAQAAMRDAIRDAGASAADVDYINAHGTSTPLNDAQETEAIKVVFGDHAAELIVSSTKSATGHLLGASGALEAAFSALACQRGVIPPTINYETPDPECDLDYATSGAVERPVEMALSNSFGFGGHNVCLAIRRWDE